MLGNKVEILICAASLMFALNLASLYGNDILTPWSSFQRDEIAIPATQYPSIASAEFLMSLILFLALLLSLILRRSSDLQPIDIICQALTLEEQKILKTLVDEGGSAVQKKLSRKTGLSKVKIHRLVSRLVERNILHVERQGRFSVVSLKRWVVQ